MIYYIEGDAVDLTGRTIEVHGAVFHLAKFIEGHRHGEGTLLSDRIKLSQERHYNRKPQSTVR